MSKTIFETRNIIAARFTGPDRGDRIDRTMVQIEELPSGQLEQLYPSALQGILTALHDDGLPKHTQGEVSSPYVLVALCELLGGRLEARMVLGDEGAQGLTFVLRVDRPNDEVHEELLSVDAAKLLVSMQMFNDGLVRP